MNYLVMGRRCVLRLPRIHFDTNEVELRRDYWQLGWHLSWILPIGSRKFAQACLDEYSDMASEEINHIAYAVYRSTVSELQQIISEMDYVAQFNSTQE